MMLSNLLKLTKYIKNDVLPFCHLVNMEISVTSDIHDFKLLVALSNLNLKTSKSASIYNQLRHLE